MAKIKPVKMGAFSGINNVVPEHELAIDAEKVGCELVNAVNVDITSRGRIRRRPGSTKLLSLPDSHSFWATADEQRAFFIYGAELREATYNGTTWGSTALRGGMQIGSACAFLETPDGQLFYSNGVQRGRIGVSSLREWGVEKPAAATAVAAGAGTLPLGRYQVTMTFVNDLGEEGGAAQPVAIDLAVDGGIAVTLPSATTAEVVSKILYCTTPNGEVFFAVKTVPVATGSLTISSMPDGGELETLNMDQLPAGAQLAEYNGRLYAASSNVVWYTEPYRYGLTRLGRNFVPFDGPVAVLIASSTELWISTETLTYGIKGDSPLEAVLDRALPYGAIPGTGFDLPDLKSVGWFSPRGICVAMADGVKNQTDGRIILQPYQAGRAIVRERDGVRQFIGTMKDSASPNTLRVSDFAEAELRRKGE